MTGQVRKRKIQKERKIYFKIVFEKTKAV